MEDDFNLKRCTLGGCKFTLLRPGQSLELLEPVPIDLLEALPLQTLEPSLLDPPKMKIEQNKNCTCGVQGDFGPLFLVPTRFFPPPGSAGVLTTESSGPPPTVRL